MRHLISHAIGVCMVLNEYELNKIIRTQSLLSVIDHATQSSGRSIIEGALDGSSLPCAQHGGQIHILKKILHTCNTNAQYSILSTGMSRTLIQDSVYVHVS